MYKVYLLFSQILLTFSFYSYSQVGIGTTNPDNSAKLEVYATDKGILIPRLTVSQRIAITNPAEGLLVYQTNDIKGFYYFDGSNWIRVLNDQKDKTPTGSVITMASENVPNGYLECNGAAISRTTYSNLFSKIGTRYGNGDGTTTFNLPDYRGYFLRGFSNGSNNDPDALTRTDSGDGTTGDSVGTRQTGEIISHAHQTAAQASNTSSNGSHSHTVSSFNSSSGGGHNHYVNLNGNSGYANASHSHNIYIRTIGVTYSPSSSYKVYSKNYGPAEYLNTNTSGYSHNHSLSVSGNTSTVSSHVHTIPNHNTNSNGSHSHNFTIPQLSTNSIGGNENRPKNISVMYCIKY